MTKGIPITHSVTYKHGTYQRMGDHAIIDCDNDKVIMPAGLTPDYEHYLKTNTAPWQTYPNRTGCKSQAWVKIKGWAAVTRMP